MELKRILARDTRSATEKAIALYGPDVLVISNHQAGGQTELVVALDVKPETATPAATPATPARQGRTDATEPRADFRQTFMAAQRQAAAPTAPPAPAQAEPSTAQVLSAHTAPLPGAPAQGSAPEDLRDQQRGREIVDLVRDEIAALRREFRLSQQAAAWQGGLQLHPSLSPLVDALNDSGIPMALRTLLLDGLPHETSPHAALAAWRTQLEHSLARPQAALPCHGVQVLAGPSGGGKTLMTARLARHACQLHGAEGVALISYRDQRAGAWSQTQMLGAQLGVECFRASDEEALRLLLSELAPRPLVLIDTPGVQMAERLAEIRRLAPQAGQHAVVPADASGATLRKVLLESPQPWQSLMLSKVDEASAPWALLQLVSNNVFQISCASNGNRMSDLIHAFTMPQLVELALAPLARCVEAPAPPALQAQPAPSLHTSAATA